jgi:membrane peptidoglycan carboxypeptidase
MRQSLARSLNTTAVQTLYLAGINTTIDLATRMGITTLTDRSRIGLSLVLGGVEVRPIDMVSAYGVFANDGIRVPWGFIQRIENNETILEERTISSERVLSAQTARTMSDVLSDNNARAAAFGPSSSLVVPGYSVAVKTGTTQENRDAWVVGYSPTISVGVWAGNNRNESMTAQGAGLSAAGPLWNEFITYTLRSRQSRERFTNPNPVTTGKIMLNGAYTSFEYPTPHSILFYVDKENPLGPIPTNPASDPQFRNWEAIVQRHYPAVQPTELPSSEFPFTGLPTTTP